jgi:hypothetical protein
MSGGIEISDIPVTGSGAKAWRGLNKYGMNLADFVGLTTNSSFSGFGNGTGYSVANWISDGVFANLAAVQAVYPVCQGTSDTVDWVILQSAVDFMIYGSLGNSNYGSTKRKLFIPAGVFQCNHPLQIGYSRVGTPPANLNGNGYVSITIEGEGPHYDPSGNGMTGTTLYFPYTDDVGIAVNRGVQVYIREMTVKGGLSYLPVNNGILNTAGVWDLANWNGGSIPADNWIGGDAVNIGIALDPYSNGDSAAAYPARILPAYFGGGTTTATYTGAGGSHCTLENVNIAQWVIGYGRAHGDSNGEFIRHHVGNYSHCIYGIVNGHSQARNNSFRDLDFFGFHTAISNRGGTQGNANMHGSYDNIHAAYGFQLYNNDESWSGNVTLRNCYVEGVYRIGTSYSCLELDTCYFSIYDQNGTGYAAYDHYNGEALSLKNCFITARNGFVVRQHGNSPTPITAENCSIQTWVGPSITGDAANATRYINGIFGVQGGGSRTVKSNSINLGGAIGNETQIPIGVRRDKNGLTHAGLDFIDYATSFADNRLGNDGNNSLMGPLYRYPVPRPGHQSVNIGTMASRSGTDCVFPRFSFGTLKADVGDIFTVYISGSYLDPEYVMVVTSISGSDMTLRQLNGFYSATTNSYATDGKTQLTAGNAYNATYICTRVRYNPYLVMGSVTDGSEIITNVKHGLGSGNAVTTTHLTMAVGDLFIHPEIEMLNAGGSPTSPLNIVTAIDTTAQTITLTDNFNVTNAHYPVVFYVKVFNA